jgi:beta-glucosidase
MEKKSNSNRVFRLVVFAGILITNNSFSQTVESISPLEKRLDDLIAQMSTQEKIEQLYYLTDGNKR